MFRPRRRHGASARTAPEPVRQQGVWRRRLRWLGMVLVVVGMGTGLHTAGQRLLDPLRFPVRHVHVEGELRNLDEAEVRKLVQGYLGQNFFSLDMAPLRAEFAAHPWIDQVAVRRLWPASLVVRFQERIAFGKWGEEEMVDSNGRRFRPAVIRQPGPWPYLRGPDGQELALIQAYKEASMMLGEVGLKITHVVQDERRAWWMRLDNGIELSLGREHFVQRLRRFVNIYPGVLSSHSDRIAAVDLRYGSGFAVRWVGAPGVTGPGGVLTAAAD